MHSLKSVEVHCEMQVRWIALCALVHASLGSIFPLPGQNSIAANTTVGALRLNAVDSKNGTVHNKTSADRDARRRGKKKSRSTSSSSGEQFSGSADSLGIDDSDSDSGVASDEKTTKFQWTKPLGVGWRKWHRLCEPCPDDMLMKWRDPRIKWVCGGYQRARRSFKSECMMAYRNCQDGTMFVKLHDHRCDETRPGWNNGRHFFYDYRARLVDESSDGVDSSGDSPTSQDSDKINSDDV